MRKLLVAGAVLAAACVAAPQLSHATPNANVVAAKSAIAPSASVQKVYWGWYGGRRVWHAGPVVVVRPPVVVARPGVVVGVAPYSWGGRGYYHRRWYNGGWRYY